MKCEKDGIPPATMLESLQSDQKLRRLLWLWHGHDGLYGDDGEMQCMKCGGLDFKRAAIADIEAVFGRRSLAQFERSDG